MDDFVDDLLLVLPYRLSARQVDGGVALVRAKSDVFYWLRRNIPDTVEIEGTKVCHLRFSSINHVIQFKLQFDIDVVDDWIQLPLCRKIMIHNHGHPSDLIPPSIHHYLLRKSSLGTCTLQAPRISYNGYASMAQVNYIQSLVFIREYSSCTNFEQLLQLAYQLRQVYIPLPIMLETSYGDLIDVTGLSVVEVALMW